MSNVREYDLFVACADKLGTILKQYKYASALRAEYRDYSLRANAVKEELKKAEEVLNKLMAMAIEDEIVAKTVLDQ